MAEPHHDWYLREWLKTLNTTQRHISDQTDYPKSKVSKLVNCEQPYTRDNINDIARALNLKPFELLMHPDDAMALRRMRESAVQIAAERRDPFKPESDNNRTGTHG